MNKDISQSYYEGKIKLSFNFSDIQKTQQFLKIFRTLNDQFEFCEIILKRAWKRVVGILSKRINIEIPIEYLSRKSTDMTLVKSNDLSLVDVQIQLNQYRCLMIECQMEMGNASEHLREIFDTMRPVVKLEGSFEALFRVMARNMILYDGDHPEIIKEVASLVDIQEMFDEKNKKKYGTLARLVKLKDILNQEIEDYITKIFHGDPNIGMIELYRRIEKHVGKDITHIEQRITRYFPKVDGLTDLFVTNSYIQSLRSLTELIERGNMDNSEKLAMIHWIRKKYTKLFLPYTEYIKISDFQTLLERLEDDFIKSTSETLATWSNNIVDNLFRNELKPIQIREGEPIYTSGPKELFDIITEYTQPVVDFDLRDLLVRVLLTVKSMILVYIQNVRDKFLEKKSDVVSGDNDLGIVSFIPFINDFSNIVKYCRFKKKELMDIGMVKDEKYYRWMEREIPVIVEKISDQCLKIFQRLVNADLNQKLRKLFGMDWVHGRPVLILVLKRMESYQDDLHFLEARYEKGIDLEEYVVKEYIRRLYVINRKFGEEDILLIKADVRTFRTSVKRKYYKAVDFIQKLMLEDRHGSFISFLSKSVLRMYPDFPKALTEELIRKTLEIRKSPSDLRKMLEVAYMKNREVGDDVSVETFLSSIELKK